MKLANRQMEKLQLADGFYDSRKTSRASTNVFVRARAALEQKFGTCTSRLPKEPGPPMSDGLASLTVAAPVRCIVHLGGVDDLA